MLKTSESKRASTNEAIVTWSVVPQHKANIIYYFIYLFNGFLEHEEDKIKGLYYEELIIFAGNYIFINSNKNNLFSNNNNCFV